MKTGRCGLFKINILLLYILNRKKYFGYRTMFIYTKNVYQS